MPVLEIRELRAFEPTEGRRLSALFLAVYYLSSYIYYHNFTDSCLVKDENWHQILGIQFPGIGFLKRDDVYQ